MMNTDKKVRVRFALAHAGPLHIGGVRAALYIITFLLISIMAICYSVLKIRIVITCPRC